MHGMGGAVELRELRSFLAVVKAGSVTRAAEGLHITQPALSRQMDQLEHELGCKLLTRGRHGAMPTDEGLLLVSRAEALLELADKTEGELRSAAVGLEGTLAICCGQTAALDEVGRIVAAFREGHPRVRVSLYITTAESSVHRLREGRADMAVLLEPFDPAGLEYVSLQTRERWVVAMRAGDPLAGKDALTAADLATGKVVLPHRAGAQSVLASWFGRRFRRVDVVGTANLNAAGDALVRAGVGRCFQIEPAHGADDLVRIPLDPPLEVGSALAWQQGVPMSRAAAAFVDFAHKWLG